MCHVIDYTNLAPFTQTVRNEDNIKHLTFAQWFYSAFRRSQVFAFLPDWFIVLSLGAVIGWPK